MQKTILLLLLFCLTANYASANNQWSSIDQAVSYINDVLKEAPTSVTFAVTEGGETKKTDEYGSVYEFNLASLGAVSYELQGRSHFVRLVCASGEKCFYSEQNLGGGMIHLIETNSEEEAQRVVAAFKYIMESINYN